MLFSAIFGPSIAIFIEHLKNNIDSSYDMYGVLLLIAINDKNRRTFT